MGHPLIILGSSLHSNEPVLLESGLTHVLVRFPLATTLRGASPVVMVTAAPSPRVRLAAHAPPSGGTIRGLHEVPSNPGAGVEGSDGGGPVSSVFRGPDPLVLALVASFLFHKSEIIFVRF